MFSHTLVSSVSCALTFASLVRAHGFVTEVTIGGMKYPGSNGPSASPSSSPIRAVTSGDPVQDLTSQDVVCGRSATLSSSSASVKPGDMMQFVWSAEGGGNWFHTTGPILTYMAQCDGPCASYTPSDSTEWFKISEFGEKVKGTPNTWVQADLLSGAPANVTMPPNIPDGEYLVRHEIIALQNGQSVGGAELYPSCLQVTVSGGAQSTTPSPTVKFPGEYSPQDPGILGNFFNPGTVYTFPGGPVSNMKDPLTDTDDSVSGKVLAAPGDSSTGSSVSPAAASSSNMTPTSTSEVSTFSSTMAVTSASVIASVSSMAIPSASGTASSTMPTSSGKTCSVQKREISQVSPGKGKHVKRHARMVKRRIAASH